MRTHRDAIDSIRYEWIGLPSRSHREESPFALVHRRLRGRYLAAGFLAVGLAAIVAAGLWRAAPPEYVSRGLVRVDPVVPTMLGDEASPPPMFSQYVADQATYIGSRPVLERAVRSDELAAIGWPTGSDGIAGIQKRLRAVRLHNQNIIEVSARDTEPQVAAAVVNAVLAAYHEHVTEPTRRLLESRREFLTGRLGELEDELTTAQAELAAATDGFGPEVIDRLHLRRAETLLILEQQHRAWQEGELDPATAPAQSIGPVAGGDAGTARRAERLRRLESDEIRLIARMDALGGRFTDRHPMMRELAAELEEVRAAIDLHRRAMDAGLPDPAVADASGAIPPAGEGAEVATDAGAAIAAAWESRLAALRQEVATLGEQRDEARRIDARIEQLRERISDARSRLDGVAVELERGNPSRVSIAAVGEVPVTPARDRRTKLAAVGAIGGFGGGFLLVVVFGILEGRVRYAADLAAEDDLPPVLAALPRTPDRGRGAVAGVTTHRLRALLEANADPDGCGLHVVAAAGGSADEAGTGTLATSIARSFARAGRRTLLIDADLAEPGIGRAFGLEHAPGLRECLAGPEAGGRVHHAGPGDLWVLPTGGRGVRQDGAPAPLPSRRGLDELVAALRDRFDAIVVETGSAATSAETLAMAGLADTATVVVPRNARIRGVREAIEQIGRAGGTCTGVVLVNADPSDAIEPAAVPGRRGGRGGGGMIPYVEIEPRPLGIEGPAPAIAGHVHGHRHGHAGIDEAVSVPGHPPVTAGAAVAGTDSAGHRITGHPPSATDVPASHHDPQRTTRRAA